MARNVQRVVALLGTIAFAAVAGENLSLSKGLGQAELEQRVNGKTLFEKETFGGNGRTCETCHLKRTGTLGLADVQRIVEKADPFDPFLTHDALDARREVPCGEDGLRVDQYTSHIGRETARKSERVVCVTAGP